ncbi:MAG: outer membrane protein assembly factor BamA [Phycisphaeraceae bacterium]
MRYHRLLLFFAMVAAALLAPRAFAQSVDPEGRPIAEIRIRGLEEVPEQLARNQIRAEVGEPYDADLVQQDIVRLTNLGRFASVRARVEPLEAGGLVLSYRVEEQPVLRAVEITGNKVLKDESLRERFLIRAGDPVDPFLIERARQQIVDAYEERGYFVAEVRVDQQRLEQQRVLELEVREGPRVRIAELEFEGNDTFTTEQLEAQIRSDTYIPILRPGVLSREQLELDAAALREFYRNRGYLDAQVGRRIDLAPDQQSASVVFLISEGPQYHVENIRVEGAGLVPEQQIRQWLPLKPGAVYSAQLARESRETIEELYGRLGYLDADLRLDPLFADEQPRVDVLVRIEPGEPARVGRVSVRGNDVTKQRVILRQVRGMEPGRPYDAPGMNETERRLSESPLFSSADVTVLGEPGDEVRDVLIEVEEGQTGSLTFGAGVSSDVGLIGSIDLVRRNFDITDPPATLGELVTGEAFRGAGQYFSLTLQPGSETSRYSVRFREPYLLESNFFLDTSGLYFSREREEYDESRLGGTLGIGQRFGDVWSATVRGRATTVDISDIDADAPVDVFDVEGDNLLTGLGLTLERDTTNSFIFPTRGSRWQAGIERVGALGGDFDFTRLTSEYRRFWTLDEDFFGRQTVLSFRGEVGYTPEDDVPVFERFYAGGHSSFRGFEFRGVGPRGVNRGGELTDDPVGGTWMLLTGLEYNFPLYGGIEELEPEWLRGVVFTDMGTVSEDVGVDDWRVSVGAGLRLQLPFLGRAPFAIDFAWPVVKEEEDETRVFSFNLALPLD